MNDTPEPDNICNLEQIAKEVRLPYIYLTGFKISTLTRLCEDCPVVEACSPEFWLRKNDVRVHTGNSLID